LATQAIARGLEPSGRPLLHGLTPLAGIFTGLALAWGLWWLAVWPGVVGQDGLAVLLQIEGRPIDSRKPMLWYLAVKALYGPTSRVEWVIGPQLLLGALIFSRILWWCWMQGLRRCFAAIALFVCLAPPVLLYQSAMYSDGLFAAGITGLTFEAWLIVRRRAVTPAQLAWLAVLLPLALFFRANGIFMLAIFVPVLWALDRRGRLAVALLVLAWLAAFGIAGRTHRSLDEHGTLYPLALFETVNFLQPRAMGLRGPDDQVTPETRRVLEHHRPIPEIVAYYDPDYWDPLVYRPGGPDLLALSRQDKKAIVREFLCCNLWKNVPDFLASRVNVFMVALLGQGGFPLPAHTPATLAQTRSLPAASLDGIQPLRDALRGFYDWSFSLRWLLWSPLPGIALMLAVAVAGWRRRDWLLVLLVTPLALQLAGIFVFSIAGEYRYLLPFFAAAAALLPMYAWTRRAAQPLPQP
jgi:hypothetical protein